MTTSAWVFAGIRLRQVLGELRRRLAKSDGPDNYSWEPRVSMARCVNDARATRARRRQCRLA
jgi:hypothetical protein